MRKFSVCTLLALAVAVSILSHAEACPFRCRSCCPADRGAGPYVQRARVAEAGSFKVFAPEGNWSPYVFVTPQHRGYYEFTIPDSEVEGEYHYLLNNGQWGTVPFKGTYKTYIDTEGPFIFMRVKATMPPGREVVVKWSYTP